MPCSLYLSVSAAPNPALCVALFGSASRSTTPTGMSSTTNMRLTLVTSECCHGKEDKEKKNTLTDIKSENLEVRDQSVCKTTLQLWIAKHVQEIYSAHMALCWMTTCSESLFLCINTALILQSSARFPSITQQVQARCSEFIC